MKMSTNCFKSEMLLFDGDVYVNFNESDYYINTQKNVIWRKTLNEKIYLHHRNLSKQHHISGTLKANKYQFRVTTKKILFSEVHIPTWPAATVPFQPPIFLVVQGRSRRWTPLTLWQKREDNRSHKCNSHKSIHCAHRMFMIPTQQ
jgi:hypothetical protein